MYVYIYIYIYICTVWCLRRIGKRTSSARALRFRLRHWKKTACGSHQTLCLICFVNSMFVCFCLREPTTTIGLDPLVDLAITLPERKSNMEMSSRKRHRQDMCTNILEHRSGERTPDCRSCAGAATEIYVCMHIYIYIYI